MFTGPPRKFGAYPPCMLYPILQGNKKQVFVFSAISMVATTICYWVLNLIILIAACAGGMR